MVTGGELNDASKPSLKIGSAQLLISFIHHFSRFLPLAQRAHVARGAIAFPYSLTLSAPAIKLNLVPLNLFRTHLEHSCADSAAVGGRDGQAFAVPRPRRW